MAAQAANYVALGASRPAGRRAQDQGSHDQEVDRSPLLSQTTTRQAPNTDDDSPGEGRAQSVHSASGVRETGETREEPKPQSTAGDNKRRQVHKRFERILQGIQEARRECSFDGFSELLHAFFEHTLNSHVWGEGSDNSRKDDEGLWLHPSRNAAEAAWAEQTCQTPQEFSRVFDAVDSVHASS